MAAAAAAAAAQGNPVLPGKKKKKREESTNTFELMRLVKETFATPLFVEFPLLQRGRRAKSLFL